MWVNSQTLAVYTYVYEVRQAFPDISLPEFPTDADFEPFGVYPLTSVPKPDFDSVNQNCNAGNPEDVDGVWYETWVVTPATPEEIAERKAQIRQDNKQQASILLSETDWTATIDINNPAYSNPYLENQNAFLAYRSQVRQIAVNPPDYPATFPDKPQEVWINI